MMRAEESRWKEWLTWVAGAAVGALVTGVATALGEEVVREVARRREKKRTEADESLKWREYLQNKRAT